MNRTNWTDLLYTDAPGWSILVRLLVGLVVFLPEGEADLSQQSGSRTVCQNWHSVSRRDGPFVGVVETVCGALISLGCSRASQRFR
jgi:hypothetical protein